MFFSPFLEPLPRNLNVHTRLQQGRLPERMAAGCDIEWGGHYCTVEALNTSVQGKAITLHAAEGSGWGLSWTKMGAATSDGHVVARGGMDCGADNCIHVGIKRPIAPGLLPQPSRHLILILACLLGNYCIDINTYPSTNSHLESYRHIVEPRLPSPSIEIE